MGASNSKIKIIIVVGPYGSGKSQFIDCLTQQTHWAKHGLEAYNDPIRSFKVNMRNSHDSVVLVDTPGFDNRMKYAEDVLEEVNQWLQQNKYKGSKWTGILYLQDIQDNRWTKPPPARILQDLCGDTGHLMFVTTHWDQVAFAQGVEREAQIQSRLRSVLEAGVRTARFDMRTESAWRIIENLVDDEGSSRGVGQVVSRWAELQPKSSIFPLSRPAPLAAISTSVENNDAPSTTPHLSSIVVPLHNLPATSTPEADNYVPSASPEPSSMTVSLFRLRPSSTPAEEDNFSPSAPASRMAPLYRLPATFTTVGDDDFVPSIIPEPSSIPVLLYRLPATSTTVDSVPSAAPNPLSITIPLYRLPATSTPEDGDFVPSSYR